MSDKEKVKDIVRKLGVNEEQLKYLDIELSYQFADQSKIDNTIKAINSFIELHNEGLVRTNYNVLNYSYGYNS